VKVGFASARWVAALLAVGGLALAQDRLIVDPWKHAVSALFPTPKSEPLPASTRAVGVASFPLEPATGPLAVVPVGPPLVDAPVDPWAAVVVAPIAPADDVVDPWPGSPARADAATSRQVAGEWAWRIREIVDPWARGPVAFASRDPLIVDPWARSRQ
jgi:hypothetical protein